MLSSTCVWEWGCMCMSICTCVCGCIWARICRKRILWSWREPQGSWFWGSGPSKSPRTSTERTSGFVTASVNQQHPCLPWKEQPWSPEASSPNFMIFVINTPSAEEGWEPVSAAAAVCLSLHQRQRVSQSWPCLRWAGVGPVAVRASHAKKSCCSFPPSAVFFLYIYMFFMWFQYRLHAFLSCCF